MVNVQMYTHYSRSGSCERIAEITGLDGNVFIRCDYHDVSQVVAAISKAFGIPRDQVTESRTTEPVASDFADYRRWAKEESSEAARKIQAAM